MGIFLTDSVGNHLTSDEPGFVGQDLVDNSDEGGVGGFKGRSRIRITSDVKEPKEIFPWQDSDQP